MGLTLIAPRARPGDRFIYQGLLLLVLWSPIPLGSNRPWSAALLMAVIFLLAAAWLCLYSLGKVEITPAFISAKPCLLALALGVALNAVQVIPLPVAWVQALSQLKERRVA